MDKRGAWCSIHLADKPTVTLDWNWSDGSFKNPSETFLELPRASTQMTLLVSLSVLRPSLSVFFALYLLVSPSSLPSLPPADNERCPHSKNWRRLCAPTLCTASMSKHRAQCQGRPPPLLPTYAAQTRGGSSTRRKWWTIYIHEWIRSRLTDGSVLVHWPGSINMNTRRWR